MSYWGKPELAANLNSASQRARVITEGWVAQHGYCLACCSTRLLPTSPNTPARDFECDLNGHPYELKSSSSTFGRIITDGAYSSMMTRIRGGTVADLLLLEYGSGWQIKSMSAIHRLLITESVIQERRPLAVTARRAGWIGCNILLHKIPPEGRIPLITGGEKREKEEARGQYALTEGLSQVSPSGRNWLSAVLSGLHRLGKQSFTIQEAYVLEDKLAAVFPRNKHVRSKIRQQLQVLRNAGLLEFKSRGEYRLVYKRGA